MVCQYLARPPLSSYIVPSLSPGSLSTSVSLQILSLPVRLSATCPSFAWLLHKLHAPPMPPWWASPVPTSPSPALRSRCSLESTVLTSTHRCQYCWKYLAEVGGGPPSDQKYLQSFPYQFLWHRDQRPDVRQKLSQVPGMWKRVSRICHQKNLQSSWKVR